MNNIQSNPKSGKSVSFYTGLFADFLYTNILNYLLELNKNVKYLSHEYRALKWGLRGVVAPLTHKYDLIFNFKLSVPNICFIFHSFIWETECFI